VVEHFSEEEQAEALKKWLNENLPSLLGSIVLALAIVFGYQYWQDSAREEGEAASAIYQQIVEIVDISPLEEISEENKNRLADLSASLKQEYKDSVYSQFAAMLMAKLAVDANQLDKARVELEWALKQTSEEPVEMVIRQSLARVLLAEGNVDEALKLVDVKDTKGFNSSMAEIRGDIYKSQGKFASARQAYQQALQAFPEGLSNPVLEMKLSDIPLDAVDGATEEMMEVTEPSGEIEQDQSQSEQSDGEAP